LGYHSIELGPEIACSELEVCPMWNIDVISSSTFDRLARLACAIVIGSLVFYGFR
jgi:hypothetical protein